MSGKVEVGISQKITSISFFKITFSDSSLKIVKP